MQNYQRGASPILIAEVIVVFLAVFAAVYFGFLRQYIANPSPTAISTATISPTASPAAEIYRNTQYGFEITLNAGWKGYAVLTGQWEGRDIATSKVTARGPLITLRHPKWTAANPYEDMPVMVFTPSQWNLILQEKMSVGAAPIPPSELDHNAKYVFALPARYNYDFATGWEEVDRLVHTLKAF